MVFSQCLQNYQNSSLKVSSKYIFHFHCHCLCLRICLWHCIFLVMVIFSHQSELMSQRPQVSKITLWRCSLNVFVIVIDTVFVVVFFIVLSWLHARMMILFFEHLSPVRRMVPSWKYICLRCNKCQQQNLWHDKEKIVIFVSFLISPNLSLETISGKLFTLYAKHLQFLVSLTCISRSSSVLESGPSELPVWWLKKCS